MSKDLNLSIKITANAGPAKKALEDAGSSIAKMQNRFAKMGSAREALGIRSEKAIQREIKQTEAAYNRLHRSGQVGAREMGRAFDAMRSKVKGLRQEMEGVTRTQKTWGMAKTGAVIGAGVGAGAYALAQPVKRVMDYDRELAMASNTIFADKKAAERIAGSKRINAAIEQAVIAGGGNRLGALEGANALIGQGTFGQGEAGREAVFKLLPLLQKYQTGTGAETGDLANLMAKAKGFGIALDDMSYAMDIGISGANSGGMELRDQSRWLPKQLALAKGLGMSGTKDFAKIVAANQASFTTAGSADEAGNNLLNFMGKINSTDTALDFKKQGINLNKELVAGRAKGQDTFDTFLNLVDRVVSKDKRYAKLQAQIEKSTDKNERLKLAESQAEIVRGSAVGSVLQDREAKLAYIGLSANRNFMNETTQTAIGARGIGEENFATMAATNSFKTERLGNQKEFKEREALEGLTDVIGDVSDKLADYAGKYPALATAIAGATTALTTLGAAGAGIGVGNVLTSGVAGAAGGTAAGVAAGGGSALGFAALMARFPKIGPAGAVIGAGAAGYATGTLANNYIVNPAVAKLTGQKDNTFGGWLYEKMHSKELAELNKPIPIRPPKTDVNLSGNMRVTVDLKNNTASVTQTYDDRRIQQQAASGRTMPTVTTGIRG